MRKTVSRIIYGLLIIAALVSCTDDNPSGSGGNITNITIIPTALTVLTPVVDSVITVDTIVPDTAVLVWDSTAGTHWYRVYLYDTADTSAPAFIISGNTNTCRFCQFKKNHVYTVQIYTVKDTVVYDSSHIHYDSARVYTHYGSDILGVYLIKDTADTIIEDSEGNQDTLHVLDSSVAVISHALGYYICIDTTRHFSVVIDSSTGENILYLLPDTYTPTVTLRFPSYQSPVIAAKQYPTPDSLVLAWQEVVGDSVKGYRVYIRDYTGVPIDSIDVDTGDTGVTLYGNLITTAKGTQVTLNTVSDSAAYKINVATLSPTGPGAIDSGYVLDITDTTGTALKLPYAYYSTFPTPARRCADTLVGIKGGIFLMGETWAPSDISFSSGAKPAHEVIVSSFYLGRYEVTCADYASFLNAVKDSITADSANPACLMYKQVKIADTSKATWYIVHDGGVYAPAAGRETFPVVSLYWHGAAAYCNWLSEQDSLLENCYDSLWSVELSKNGFRLPTEAEFEYAASIAFTGNKGRFPWGYVWDNTKAAVDGDSLKPVGSYAAYHGLYDLIGNALEYIGDWSDDLTGLFLDSSSYYVAGALQGVVIDPAGPQPQTGYRHMVRGGSYASGEEECVTYCRFIHPASGRLSEYGFRIARAVH